MAVHVNPKNEKKNVRFCKRLQCSDGRDGSSYMEMGIWPKQSFAISANGVRRELPRLQKLEDSKEKSERSQLRSGESLRVLVSLFQTYGQLMSNRVLGSVRH